MISFIIPVHNIPNIFLNRCLKSFFSQKNIEQCEIIVINDASPINENDTLCIKFKKYKNFKYIKFDKNLGVSTARFVGLSHANKEFCCFFDADDFMNINSLEILLETLKKEGKKYDIWKGIERFVNANTLEIESKSPNTIKEYLHPDFNYYIRFYENSMIGGKLLKTWIAKDVSMYAQKIQNHEDLFFILCYTSKINWERMGQINHEIFSICNRNTSASHNPNIYEKCLSFIWFLDMFYLYRLSLDEAYLQNNWRKKISFEISKIIDLFFWDIVRVYQSYYEKEKRKVDFFYKLVIQKLKKDYGIKKIPREQNEIYKIKKEYKQKNHFKLNDFIRKVIKFILQKLRGGSLI